MFPLNVNVTFFCLAQRSVTPVGRGHAALCALLSRLTFSSLFSAQFMDCFMIGRDLVRLLQNVARIPEFDSLWKDMLHNPPALNPQFTGTSLPPLRPPRLFITWHYSGVPIPPPPPPYKVANKFDAVPFCGHRWCYYLYEKQTPILRPGGLPASLLTRLCSAG